MNPLRLALRTLPLATAGLLFPLVLAGEGDTPPGLPYPRDAFPGTVPDPRFVEPLLPGSSGRTRPFRAVQVPGVPLEEVWRVSGTAYATAWGDIDGDGRLDLVLGRSGRVHLHLNSGGMLEEDPIWTSGMNVSTLAVALGDLDGDGDLDLVCANASFPNTVYRNEGGGFTPDPVWMSPDSLYSTDVALADFDRDGDLDIVFGNARLPNLPRASNRIHRNDGGVIVPAPVWEAQGDDTRGIDVGDLNGDGFLDLVCANFGGELPDTIRGFGRTVASAGDLNGDGSGDLVSSAELMSDGKPSGTRVYVFFGGVGMDSLADVILPDEGGAGDLFGSALAGAGDVNGDGFDDLVVGAPGSIGEGVPWGRVYLFLGGSPPDSIPDLELSGEEPFDQFGYRVAGAGDVNGDGYDDFLVGAHLHDGAGTNAGKTYLYLGSAFPDTVAALELSGEEPFDQFGWNLAAAGDVNGDGYGDFLVGAPVHDGAGTNAGKTYLYLGSAVPDTTVDLELIGGAAHDQYGAALTGAGDVNGDGYDDFLVGAPFNDRAGTNSGEVYLHLGSASPDTVADAVFPGEAPSDLFGLSLAGAGDVNGDGYDDFLVGAPFNDEAGTNHGKAYLYHGGPVPDAAADLEITGKGLNFDSLGYSLAGIPDLGGTGTSGIAIGAPGSDLGGSDAGRVDIHFGGPGIDPVSDLSLVGRNASRWRGGRNSIYISSEGVLPAAASWRSGREDFNHDVALGDVDGDGDLDPVFAGFVGQGVLEPPVHTWYPNEVDSVAANPVWEGQASDRAVRIELGDLDQDGDLDLVAGGQEGYSAIFLNRDGTYGVQADGTLPDLAGSYVYGMALGDFDDDGDLDVSLALSSSGSALIRNGQQLWFSADSTWSTGSPSQSYGVALGDLDGNGYLDLVFANEGSQKAYYNLDGMPERVSGWAQDQARNAWDVELADLDRDGFPEAVFSTPGPEPFFGHENDAGILSPTAWEVLGNYRTFGVDLDDVNLDGKIDLVSANATFNTNLGCGTSSISNTVHIGFGAAGRFSPNPNWESSPPHHHSSDVAAVDLDGDLDLDLVFANTCSQANTAYLNNGGTVARRPFWFSSEEVPSNAVAVGDVNGDTRFDLVFGNSSDVSVYLAIGDSTFVLGGTLAGGGSSLALGDVDADGNPDCVVGKFGRNTLHMNRSGAFTVSPVWSSTLSRLTRAVALGDLDRDGDLDLVCADDGRDNLSEVNTIHQGLRNPAYRGDPLRPTNHTAQNGSMIRNARFDALSLTRYQVRFEVVDVESDPVLVHPEFRIPPDRTWQPVVLEGEGIRLGPLTSSPEGVAYSFEWDTLEIPLSRNRIEVRFRWTPVPRASVGRVRRSGIYLHDLGALPARPVAKVPGGIEFPVVTTGDTTLTMLTVANAGTDLMAVTDIQFPDPSLSTTQVFPLSIRAATSATIPIAFVPGGTSGISASITVTTNDPVEPVLEVPVTGEVLPLDAALSVLAPAPAPLGEALTVLVSPSSHVESGALIFVLERDAGGYPAGEHEVPLFPVGGEFIGVIPAAAVTELGVRYYVRLENSSFSRLVPDGAPAASGFHPVRQPDEVAMRALPNLGSGYLENFGITIQLLLEPGTVFESGEVHYRRGGETGFRERPLSLEGILPSAVIPDSVVGPRGIEYWVRVTTASQTVLQAPAQPLIDPATLQVTALDLPEPAMHPGNAYRMLSIPLEFGPEFTGTLESLLSDQDEFGSYDRARWRAFRWSPGPRSYVELDTAAAGTFTPAPGKAFWLIARALHRVDTRPIAGQSTPTDRPYPIVLDPGWNQVGNPFLFPVAWNRVFAGSLPVNEHADVSDLVFYNGSIYEEMDSTAVLEPFRGYWVHNRGANPVELRVPPVEAPAGSASPAEQPAARSSVAGGWWIQVAVSCEGGRDPRSRIGVASAASPEGDRLDRYEPPMVPSRGLAVFFPRGDWKNGSGALNADIRPPTVLSDGGEVWTFDVAKNFRDRESGDRAELEFGLHGFPEGLRLVLHDRRFDRLVDLEEVDGYIFFLGEREITGDPAAARFALVVGTDAFVDAYGEGSGSFSNLLFQNYPNPFRSDTMIRYEVANRGPASLQVHDIQGRLVRVLVSRDHDPGRYEAFWDGRNERGQEVPPGIYFYRMQGPGRQETRRMVRIR